MDFSVPLGYLRSSVYADDSAYHVPTSISAEAAARSTARAAAVVAQMEGEELRVGLSMADCDIGESKRARRRMEAERVKRTAMAKEQAQAEKRTKNFLEVVSTQQDLTSHDEKVDWREHGGPVYHLSSSASTPLLTLNKEAGGKRRQNPRLAATTTVATKRPSTGGRARTPKTRAGDAFFSQKTCVADTVGFLEAQRMRMAEPRYNKKHQQLRRTRSGSTCSVIPANEEEKPQLSLLLNLPTTHLGAPAPAAYATPRSFLAPLESSLNPVAESFPPPMPAHCEAPAAAPVEDVPRSRGSSREPKALTKVTLFFACGSKPPVTAHRRTFSAEKPRPYSPALNLDTYSERGAENIGNGFFDSFSPGPIVGASPASPRAATAAASNHFTVTEIKVTEIKRPSTYA